LASELLKSSEDGPTKDNDDEIKLSFMDGIKISFMEDIRVADKNNNLSRISQISTAELFISCIRAYSANSSAFLFPTIGNFPYSVFSICEGIQ